MLYCVGGLSLFGALTCWGTVPLSCFSVGQDCVYDILVGDFVAMLEVGNGSGESYDFDLSTVAPVVF